MQVMRHKLLHLAKRESLRHQDLLSSALLTCPDTCAAEDLFRPCDHADSEVARHFCGAKLYHDGLCFSPFRHQQDGSCSAFQPRQQSHRFLLTHKHESEGVCELLQVPSCLVVLGFEAMLKTPD